MVRFLNWYMGKLHVAAHTDAQVSIAFLKVINMIASPPSMMHPRIVWRIMKAHLRADKRKIRIGEEHILRESGSVTANR